MDDSPRFSEELKTVIELRLDAEGQQMPPALSPQPDLPLSCKAGCLRMPKCPEALWYLYVLLILYVLF